MSMSQPTGGEQTGQDTTDAQAGGEQPEQAPEQDTVEYWKQRSRQHEDRAKQLRKQVKDLEPKATELDQRKQAEQSEVDKANDARAALETRAATAEQDLARYRAAVKAGVTGEDIDTFASRLRGENAEELEADAAELKQMIAGNGQPEPQRKPDRSQGAASGQAATPAQELATFMQNLK